MRFRQVFQRIGTLLVIQLMLLYGNYVSADDLSDCLGTVDELRLESTGLGLEVGEKRQVRKAEKFCQKAVSSTPSSFILRTALARVLIWSENDSAALIHLEIALNDDPEAAELAIALCASGRGGKRVVETSCQWASIYTTDDPGINFAAAKELIDRGDAETGLSLLAQAAVAGSPEALSQVMDYCQAFDADNPASPIATEGVLKTYDPPYVAAVACEAAFLATTPDSANWASYGWQYVASMIYFDAYAEIGEALYALATSSDPSTSGVAIETAASICLALAGDPEDPIIGSEGVYEHEIIPERAVPACEIATYLWPDNGALQHSLSRAYGMSGDDLSAYAALEAAKSAGYSLAGNFDPSAYSMPDLIAALYHGDVTMLAQVEMARQNVGVMTITLGKEFNLFLFTYLQGFVTEHNAKEDFRCEPPFEVTFSGKALADIQKRANEAAMDFMATAFGLKGESARNKLADENLAMIFGGSGSGSGSSSSSAAANIPFLSSMIRTKYNTIDAQATGPRDAAMFLNQTNCTKEAEPLVRNVEAYLAGQPFPFQDLFYLSRYDPTSGEKLLYDQCGIARVGEDIDQNSASAQCRCLVTRLLEDGVSDEDLLGMGRTNVLESLRTAASGAAAANAAEQCSLL